MCGILGFVKNEGSDFLPHDVPALIKRLLLLSESRGKDASGICLVSRGSINVLKRPVRAKSLIQSKEYTNLFESFMIPDKGFNAEKITDSIVVMGHARMVTNGSEETHENNQPVIKNGMVCLHNGIVTNDLDVWKQYRELKRVYEVDTEAILDLISYYRYRNNSLVDSVTAAFQFLKGANSIALLAEDLDEIVLATTNGSAYYSVGNSGHEMVFASEKYILEKVIRYGDPQGFFRNCPIIHVKPNEGYIFGLADLRPVLFSLHKQNTGIRDIVCRNGRRSIYDLIPSRADTIESDRHNMTVVKDKSESRKKLLTIDHEAIAGLKRCSRCLLPETFPFIEYDEHGVCIYCRSYKKLDFEGEAALKKRIKDKQTTIDQPNCIVAFSGGRDSSYGLHYVRKELGLNPIAYTYDWGMVTDLARRNISRICGALGVEHILISADIKKKRSYIRKNVLAWLKEPNLGTIPLFMAGDKQYFYYANKLMEQYGIDLFFMSENRLERTHFKHGFCGIRHRDSSKPPYFLDFFDKFKLAAYYGEQYLRNPRLINSSLADTLGAFISYYLIRHQYLYLFNYIPWQEDKIEKLLIDTYDWEISPDTKSTWRIGDGTAAFYNYIYYAMVGFTENDTFRSNQIREGMITREEAMKMVEKENEPRFESIQWYCDTIGIDFDRTIKKINLASKLIKPVHEGKILND
jgi:glutamine---fructose-6-phosphate transaminase (isomerizing)